MASAETTSIEQFELLIPHIQEIGSEFQQPPDQPPTPRDVGVVALILAISHLTQAGETQSLI